MTVIPALLGVEVQYLPLFCREASPVLQDGAVNQRGGNNGRDIECLTALGFSRRCAEVAEGGDGRVPDPEYLRRNVKLVRCLDCRIAQEGCKFRFRPLALPCYSRFYDFFFHDSSAFVDIRSH